MLAAGQGRALRQELMRTSSVFLQENTSAVAVQEAARDYFSLLCRTAGLDASAAEGYSEDIRLPQGKSIGPLWAAYCIQDFVRTRRFVRGLAAAVRAVRQRYPDEPVHLLYAGTGPFAALVLPLTTMFRPEELQFTLLEVQPESYRLLDTTLQSLSLGPYVREMTMTDACSWRPAAGARIHILLTETMQAALDKEPQVAITTALSRFLLPEGLLIPERIAVRPGMVYPSGNQEHPDSVDKTADANTKLYAPVFELTRNTPAPGPDGYPAVDVRIPVSDIADGARFFLFTEIEVFGGETIGIRQSGLTNPKYLWSYDPAPIKDPLVRFQYRTGPNPTLKVTPVDQKEQEADWSSDSVALKLPFSFDPERLIADLAVCEAAQWQAHFNQRDYAGDWTGIALRSRSGESLDISAHSGDWFEDTPLLASCPYFREILDRFPFEKETVRLLALAPGSVIHEHRDPGLGYPHGYFRLHLPILTDDKVLFTVGGCDLLMRAGECWYADFDRPHSVRHEGTVRRVHLVIDGKRNEWTDAVFEEAGYDFEREKKAGEFDLATKKAMIEHLRLIGTPAALEIIASLESYLTEDKPVREEWSPTGMMALEEQPVCQWLNLGGWAFSEPFFEETLDKIRRMPENRRPFVSCSSLPFLVSESKNLDCLAPSAFIFHVSRCGSTLLAQMLGADRQNIVLSEAPLLDDLLRMPHRDPLVSPSEAENWFVAALRFLGRRRTGAEQHFFVKTDCWHVFFYESIRRLYPETPLVLLYRRPDEVLRSQQKLRGLQAIPQNLEPSITGITANPDADYDLDGYFCALLERLFVRFEAIARIDQRAVLVNYNEGPMGMVRKLERAAGIVFSENALSTMKKRSSYHAKRPREQFSAETEPLPDSALLAGAWNGYHQLESMRKSQDATLLSRTL